MRLILLVNKGNFDGVAGTTSEKFARGLSAKSAMVRRSEAAPPFVGLPPAGRIMAKIKARRVKALDRSTTTLRALCLVDQRFLPITQPHII